MSSQPRHAVRTASLLAALAALTIGAVPVRAAAGDADPTFSSDGLRTVSMGTGEDRPNAVVLQADGRIVVVGVARTNLSVFRLRTAGGLDPTFSGDGKTTVDLGGDDIAFAAAMQGTKVLLAGVSDADAALARLNVDGTRDGTFSGDGKLRFTLTGAESTQLAAVADAGGGKTVAVGFSLSAGIPNEVGVVVRLRANGTFDPTFSGDGLRTIVAGTAADARDVVVLGNGMLLVATNENGLGRIMRLTLGGGTDTTYGGGDGIAQSPNTFRFVAIARDGGKLVAVGQAGAGIAGVARFLADGTPDALFGSGLDGDVLLSAGDFTGMNGSLVVNDVAVDASHRIIIAGTNGADQVIIRLTVGGKKDVSFNGGLGFLTAGGAFTDVMTGVRLDTAGRIVAVGTHGLSAGLESDQDVRRFLGQ